jgi:GTP-binding protein
LIIKSIDLMATAAHPSQFPTENLPEIALAGRSNVGKSSLINALLNRKSMARVGNTPGKTRVINFYNVNNELVIVDLPGYGYAKVSKREKKTWANLAETYFNTRSSLKLIILLLDIRHRPSNDDITMLDYIRQTGRDTVVVATKADKLSRFQANKSIEFIRSYLNLEKDIIIPFSAVKRMGVDMLWSVIESCVKRKECE